MAAAGPRADGRAESAAPAGPVRALARTLLSFAQTRAQLAANELEEQSLRFSEIALWALAALFCFGVAVLMACAFTVILFWDSGRLLAAGLLAALFFAAGAGAALVARKRLRERPKLLSATLAELAKDRERLERS